MKYKKGDKVVITRLDNTFYSRSRYLGKVGELRSYWEGMFKWYIRVELPFDDIKYIYLHESSFRKLTKLEEALE